jgi:hypothetical protein
MKPDCPSTAELLDYWLSELSSERALAVEAHLFECSACNTRLEGVVNLGLATRELIRQGRLAAILTPAALHKLKTSGLRIREYRLEPNGSVNCTIAPDDDLVAAHLSVPLAGVQRLDLVFEDVQAAQQFRVPDIGFDSTLNEIVMLPRAEELRALDRATLRARLLAVDEGGERLLGEYEFRHSPHSNAS